MLKKPPCRICKTFRQRKGLEPDCEKCLPELDEINRESVDIFMLARHKIRYSPMGKPIGLDLDTIIQLVKLMNAANPIDTIENVLILSDKLIKHHG